MLTEILEMLARKESISLTQLAHEINHSVKEIESALELMEHMGYIRNEQFGQACGSNCSVDRCSNHCEGCGFVSTETFNFWTLTERGQRLVASKT